MYSHVTVGTNDIARAKSFYDPVLAALGISLFHEGADRLGYGEPKGPQFWVMTPFDGAAATVGNGCHVAFVAPNRDVVNRFHATALKLGATDEGAPGPRPHYHRNYYGAYLRDLDGNKLQAVCHLRE